jgi:hypothetical protein
MVAADGSINRKGNGSEGGNPRDLCIGIDQTGMFARVKSSLTDEMLRHTGGYEISDIKGQPCTLTIGLEFSDGSKDGFEFKYGTKSQGPPGDIRRLIMAVLKETDPWYTGMLKAATKKSNWLERLKSLWNRS